MPCPEPHSVYLQTLQLMLEKLMRASTDGYENEMFLMRSLTASALGLRGDSVSHSCRWFIRDSEAKGVGLECRLDKIMYQKIPSGCRSQLECGWCNLSQPRMGLWDGERGRSAVQLDLPDWIPTSAEDAWSLLA